CGGVGLKKAAIRIANCAPIVDGRRLGLTQRGSHDLERKLLDGGMYHLLEGLNLDAGNMLVQPLYLQAKRRGEIFLVADHDVYVRSQASVNLLGTLLAANTLPQRLAIIKIIRNYGAVFARRAHGFQSYIRRGFREGAEDTAGMEPTSAALAEDFVPIDLGWLELGDRRMAPIRAPQGSPNSKAALGEVQP